MNYNDFLRAVSKKEVTGAYILHGQEEFTKNRAIEKLTELLNPNMRSVNLQSYEKTGAEELINACETMPFFDRLRLIIVQTVPDGDEARRILDFLDTMPESTLLMLVSAFAGKDRVFLAYEEAIRERYRFFSFGDAMLII